MFLTPVFKNFTDIVIVMSSNTTGLKTKNRIDPHSIAESIYDVNIG
jgi:hypothetical protein